MKGFQRLIPMMRYLPEADLRIAGTGPYEAELRAMARDLSNVHFEGLLGGSGLARLFRGARAVVVPSLFPETFGYVVLEAFAVRTPVIVHEDGGAIYETGVQSGGGLGYRSDIELLTSMRRILHEPDLRRARWLLAPAASSVRLCRRTWSWAAGCTRDIGRLSAKAAAFWVPLTIRFVWNSIPSAAHACPPCNCNPL